VLPFKKFKEYKEPYLNAIAKHSLFNGVNFILQKAVDFDIYGLETSLTVSTDHLFSSRELDNLAAIQ